MSKNTVQNNTSSPQDKLKKTLSVSKAAQLLGISSSTLRNYEKDGRIESFRKENGYREFNLEDIKKLKAELNEEKRIKREEEKRAKKERLQKYKKQTTAATNISPEKQTLQTQAVPNTSDASKQKELTPIKSFSGKLPTSLLAILLFLFVSSLALNTGIKRAAQQNAQEITAEQEQSVLGKMAGPYAEVLGYNVKKGRYNLVFHLFSDFIENANFQQNITVAQDVTIGQNLSVTGLSTQIGGIETPTITFTGTGTINELDAIDVVTEDTLELALDVAGDVVSVAENGLTEVRLADEISYDGTITISGTINIDGTFELGGTAVEATADELNALSGIETSDGGIYFASGNVLTQDSENLFWDDGNARLGIGTNSPSFALDVAGTINATGFRLPTGAVAGYILSSDANGLASWTPNVSSQWTLSGSNLYPNLSSYNVGIGTSNPTEALTVGNGAFTVDRQGNVTLANGALLDLSNIVHDDSAPQGLKLPQAASLTNLSGSEEGYIGYDTSSNEILVWNGASWQNITGASTTLQQAYEAGNSVQLSAGEGDLRIYNDSAQELLFLDESTGFVGIGGTSPNEALDLAGRIFLGQTTAPGTTTDRLYNVGGALYWNGIDISSSGGLFTDGGAATYLVSLTDDLAIGGSGSSDSAFYFDVSTSNITLEGSSADANELTFSLTNPTLDRTITIPDASGEISVIGQTIEGSEITDGTIEEVDLEATNGPTDNFILSFDLASGGFTWIDPSTTGVNFWTDSGSVTYLTSLADDLAIGGSTASDSSFFVDISTGNLVFEGVSEDAFETTFTITDPTADNNIVFPNSSGTVSLLGSSIDLGSEVTGTLPASNGGTGVDGSTAANGELLIGNGGGFSIATLTQGTGITITNGSGSIQIASTLGTNIDNTEIVNDTIIEEDLDVTNAPTDNYLLSYDLGSGGFTWIDPSSAGLNYWSDSGTVAYLTALTDDLAIGGSTAADSSFYVDTSTSNISFEGASEDAFETTFIITDPTADRSITFPNLSGTVSLLDQTIEGSEITDGTIEEVDLEVTNGPSDNYLLTFDLASGGFTWVDPATAGTNYFTDSGTITYLTSLSDDFAIGGSTASDSSFFVDTSTSNITFEGASEDAFETTIAVTDPTADRTITLPNASGTISLLDQTIEGSEITDGTIEEVDLEVTNGPSDNYVLTYDLASGGFTWVDPTSTGTNYWTDNGVTTYLTSLTDDLALGGTAISDSAFYFDISTGDISFEGATANGFETLFDLTDPTADRTITIPDADGELSLLGQSIDNTEITDDTILEIDLDATNGPTAGFVLSYDNGGGFTWIANDGGSGASKWTDGGAITYLTSLTDDLAIGGTGLTDSALALDISTSNITFEGATEDAFETTFVITDPTADRSITFPNLSGTVSLLDQTIEGSEITDGTIEEVDLEATNGPTGGYVLSYDSGSGGFTWVANDGGTGASKWTDGGSVTYLTSITDDLAIGGSDPNSPFFFDESAEQLILTNTTGGLSFRVNDSAGDTTPFVVDANGNVGIGNSTPSELLSIGADALTVDVNGNLTVVDAALIDFSNIVHDDTAPQGLILPQGNVLSNPNVGEGYIAYDTDDDQLLIFNGSSWTNVSGAATTLQQAYDAGNSVQLSNTEGDLRIYDDGNSEVLFLEEGTANVGIGTTAPNEKLDLRGRLYLGQTTAPGVTSDKLYNVGGDLFWNGNEISLLGQTIEGSEITDGTIEEVDLEVTNAASDNFLLTYDLASGGFTWVNPASAGTNYFTDDGTVTYLTSLTDSFAIGGTAASDASFFVDYSTGNISFEGASEDAFETTFIITDPTADRSITFPNLSGTVSLLDQTIEGSEITDGTIEEVDLEVTNGPSDNYVLTFDLASGGFTWVDPTGVGTNYWTDSGTVTHLTSLTDDLAIGGSTAADASFFVDYSTGNISFEGASEDAFETTITITDPTADRSITLPNADGTISLLDQTIEGSEITDGTIEEVDLEVTNGPTDNYLLTFDLASGGFTWVDPASAGTNYFTDGGTTTYLTSLTDNFALGGSAASDSSFFVNYTTGNISFEGATEDAFETTFAITDPTSDRTITFPNLTGTVSLLDQTIEGSEITDGTIEEVDLEVTNAASDNYLLTYDLASGGFTWVDPTTAGLWTDAGTVTYLTSLTDDLAIGGTAAGDASFFVEHSTGNISFEGATEDAFETAFLITDPTADRSITFPNLSGTVSLLDQTIEGSEITDGTIEEVDLELTNAASDNFLLTYDLASGGFTWVDPTTAGTNYFTDGGTVKFLTDLSDDLAIGGSTASDSSFFVDISTGNLILEGASEDGFETTLAVTDPTADRTITLPNLSGTISLLDQTIEGSEITDGTIEEVDLELTNAASDNFLLTYDLASGGFTWVDPATAGTNYFQRNSGVISPVTLSDDLAIGGTAAGDSEFFFDTSTELLTLTNTTGGLSFRVNDAAGDTSPFVVDSDGNVGIGISTPANKLHVYSNNTNILDVDNGAGLIIEQGSTGDAGIEFQTSAQQFTLGIDNSSGNDNFTLFDGGTTRLTIDGSSGNLTIAQDLAINGGDLTTNQATFNLLDATPTTINFGGNATAIDIGAVTGTVSINNDLAVDGDTLIGNSAGDTLSTVDGTLFDLSSITHNDTAPQGLILPQAASLSNPNSGEGYLAWDTDNFLQVFDGTNWLEVLTTASGGSSKWTDLGTITYLTNLTDDLAIGGSDITNAPFYFDENIGDLFISGNIGIGTTSPTAKLDVSGGITLSGALTGTNGNIDFTNFDVIGASGNITTAGTLAVNGDAITSDGDLTITPAGGQLILPNGVTINGGGVTGLAYNAFADSGTASAGTIGADNDLYVQGSIETSELCLGTSCVSSWNDAGIGHWLRSGGGVIYPSTLTDDLAIGGSALSDSAFYVDEATGVAYVSNNIGIGVTGPSEALEVSGDIAASGVLSFGDSTPDNNAYNTLGTADASHTAGGEITDGSDLFITDDLEVDGTIFADGGIVDASGNAIAAYWTQTSGVLHPTTGTDDLAIGGNDSSADLFINDSGQLFFNPVSSNLTLIDASLETEWTQGTLFNANFASSTTQSGGDITGLNLDFNTNFNGTQDLDLTNISLGTPALTSTGAVTTTYRGLNLANAGALTQNTAAGTINWYGTNIAMPNITQTTGTINADGLRIVNGTITTGGTQNAVNVVASGVGAGTLRGLNIGSITGGAGSEVGINIGSGWDTALVTNNGNINAGTGTVTASNYASNTATALAINSGTTGTINIGTDTSAEAINLGTGAANKTVTIGVNNTTATTNIRSGSGGVNINASINQPVNIGTGTSTGVVTLGGTGTQAIELGTGAGIKTVNLGSTNTTSATTINAGTGDLVLASQDEIRFNLFDNNADTLDIQQGTDNYINISTLDSTENISFGNTNTNPTFNFLGSGSLTISGAVLANGNVTLGNGAGDTVATADGVLWDLSSIIHDDTAPQGLRLPQGTGFANPNAGEGYLAYDSTSNTVQFYDGAAWQGLVTTGASGSSKWTDFGTVTHLTSLTDDLAIGGSDIANAPFYFDTDIGDLFIAGNIGIGTTSPTALLSLGDTGYTFASGGLSFGDGDTGFYESSDDTLVARIAGSDELVLNGSALYPATTLGLDLGTSSNYWNDIYLNGSTIYFDDTTDATFGFNATDDKFYFNTAGTGLNTAEVVINSGGNVGIGTTAPSGRLGINAGTNLAIDLARTSAGQWINFNDGTDNWGLYNTAGSPEGVLTADTGALSMDTTNGTLYVKTDDGDNTGWVNLATGGTTPFATTGANVTYLTDLTEDLAIGGSDLGNSAFFLDEDVGLLYASGSIGIGTTAPVSELQIAGTTPTLTLGDGDAEDTQLNFDGNAFDFHFGLDDTIDAMVLGTGTTLGAGNILTIENGGSIGIGNTAPNALLDIFGTTEQLRLSYDINNYLSFTLDSSGNLTFSDSGTDIATFGETGAIFDVPASFNAAGDVSIAYDLQFTNQTSANIKSDGPLAIESGESFESLNLTLRTYNSGNTILDMENGSFVINSNDPSIIFDTLSATDTDFWLGVLEDAGNDDDDIFVIGDGNTPGSNNFLTINSSGNVGIGTTAPSSLFTIDSGASNAISLARSSAGQWIDFSDGTDNWGLYNYPGSPEGNLTADTGALAMDTTNGTLYVKSDDGDNTNWINLATGSSTLWTDNTTYISADNATNVVVADTNRIGIGITAPANSLHIYKNDTDLISSGDGSGIIIEQDSTGDAGIQFQLTGGQVWTMGIDNSSTNDDFVFFDGGTERVSIDGSTGRLQASYDFSVRGNTTLGDSSGDTVDTADGTLWDLSSITHNDTAPQGLLLPQGTSFASPNTGEGYLAYDSTANVVQFYDGSAWQGLVTTGSSGASKWTELGSTTYLSDLGQDIAIGGSSISNAPFFFDESLGELYLNGGLGIGTTSPNALTDIFGTTEQLRLSYDVSNYLSFVVGSNGELTISDTGTDIATFGATGATFEVPTTFNSAGDVSMGYDLIFTNQSASNILADGPLTITSGEVFESLDLTLQAYNNGDVRLNMADGNFVINSNDPSIVFDTLTGTDTDYWMGVIEDAGSDDDDIFVIGDGNTPGANNFLTINTSGNVGIGTTAPTDLFSIASGTANAIGLTRTSSGQWIDFNDGTDNWGLYNTAGSPEGVLTADTGALSMDTTNGTLYVKTDDGDNTGWVNLATGGTTPFATTGANVTYLTDLTEDLAIGGSDLGNSAFFFDESTGNMFVSGNVGIGTTAPGAALEVLGVGATGPALNVLADSLTTGTGATFSFDALTSGTGILVESDPGTSTTLSGDLFRINIGSNVNVTGNIFSIADNGSDLFTIDQSQITSALPHQFTAAGDVSIAYDIQFTNQTSSYIKSKAPLYIEAGESFENNDLTFITYGTGDTVLDMASGEFVIDSADPGIVFDSNTATDTDFWIGILNDGGNDDDDLLAFGDGVTTGTNNFMVIDTSGNIGIGYTAPANKIQLDSDTYATNSGWTDGSSRDTKQFFTPLENVELTKYEIGTWSGNGETIDAVEYSQGTASLTGNELLTRISDIPLYQWEYINEDEFNYQNPGEGIKHVGPTAQDFYKLFGLGSGEKTIRSMDIASVALAGVQALNNQMQAGLTSQALELSAPDQSSNTLISFNSNTGEELGSIENTQNGNITFNSGGADFAELFIGQRKSMSPGDIVCLDMANNVTKASQSCASVGVYSDNYSILGNWVENWESNNNLVPVGLVGQLEVKVNGTNGAIQPGDPITISSTNGVGSKALASGQIVGRALEGYISNNPNSVQKIKVLIQPGWFDPINTIDAAGNLAQANEIEVNYDNILDKISALDINEWTLTDNSVVKHLGPNAQEFYATFGTGNGDQLASQDVAGVALAGVRGLIERVESLELNNNNQNIEDLALTVDNIETDLTDTNAEIEGLKNELDLINELLAESQESTQSTESSEALDPDGVLAEIITMFSDIKDFVASLGMHVTTDDEGKEVLAFTNDVNITGNATLYNTTVTGSLNVGLINIDSLQQSININGPSCYNAGTGITDSTLCESQTIYVQQNLAGNVDIFNGAIVFEPNGTINAERIVAGALSIREDSGTIGQDIIYNGTKTMTIYTSAIDEDSVVIVTPETTIDFPIAVVQKVAGTSFTIEIPQTQIEDIPFSWIIIDKEQASN